MNKLRLIRIYELRGLIHPIEQSVIDLLDGIEESPIGEWIVYKKNGVAYFDYYRYTNNIGIYSVFYNFFDDLGCLCLYEEMREMIKYLLGKHLKLKFNE